MLINNRVILDDNGTLLDLSSKLGSYSSGSENFVIVAVEDKLYLGSDLPFNHRYFQVGIANVNASSISSIEYWSSNVWKPVKNIIDETSLSGATMGQSGVVYWTPDKQYGWSAQDTNDGASNLIPELSSITIYNLYWVRLTFSGDFSAGSDLKYIGHKFADDSDLSLIYPDLIRTDVLDHFQTGKLNWDEQMVSATEFIMREVQKRGIITSSNQILDPGIFTDACVHRCAELIYTGFGKDFVTNKQEAQKEYARSFNSLLPHIDTNANGILETNEQRLRTGYLSR